MCSKSTRTEIYGDCYLYNSKSTKTLKKAHKNAKESSKNFKTSIHNVVSIGTHFAKNVATVCLRFVRNCGRMYGRHLFPYGGYQ